MSAKIPSELSGDCKEFLQAVSPALQLSRSIAAQLSTAVSPLRRHKADWPICYESAIAFRIAAQQQSSPAIAAQIAADCAIEDNWTIQIAPSGLLRFQCSELETATYLQQLLSVPDGWILPKLHLERSLPTDQLFLVQYVHARCWMLLRSAEREGWFFTSSPPPALPWLTSTGKLRLQHSCERQTIGSLLDAVDALATNQTNDRLWKQAIDLSCRLDAFHAACRIWGEVKASDRPLAQARLGLAWAGQRLLQVLLHSLGLESPTLL